MGLAILAAGSSSRLGQPKQLVKFKGKALLQHIIDELGVIEVAKRWVILGANQEEIKAKIHFRSFELLMNEGWNEGIASSIRLAAEQAKNHNLDALLLVLSDQPYVNQELLNALLKLYRPAEEGIMASEYKDILGVPALFDRAYFQELMGLSGDSGARKLISAFRARVASVKFERGVLDIDTEADLKHLNAIENVHNG